MLRYFKDIPYLGYRRNKVKNQLTEANSCLVKKIYKLIKIKKHVLLRTQGVKLEVVGTKHANKKNQPVITLMNNEELEIINVTRTCDSEANKHENNSSIYDNEGEKNT